ncbi:MAG: arylsulfatase [Planctomycetes bacterium]|nr:arylsulfatase [Planctomycetota bacterium]
MPLDRRGFLTVAVGAAAAAALPRPAAGQDAQPKASHPNIIFILADDLGYGDLRCYGQKQIQTPNLDRMAAEGVRFTDCYAGSTVCAPSRCCLMTGQHTGHCLVRGNAHIPLRPEDVTVAEILKKAGYATGIIGKWGLGEPGTTGTPNKQGFDEWFGYLNQCRAHNYYPEYLWKNEKKFVLEGNHNGKKEQYSHDLFAAEALSFVRRHKDGPFFLYLAYTIPHANNELGRETHDGMEVPSYEPYADKPWPNPQKGHAAMITRMDRDIGRLLALLKELDIGENTIVFFSSDNGPHQEGGARPDFFDSNGPLRGIKRDLYEGGIRVPMIVRWPGKIKPGTVSDQVWAFWDFLPTAAEIAGVQPPDGIDGISMLPALLGREQTQHNYLYWEFHERGTAMAVRMGKWKAVRPLPKSPIELYDLSKDIGEEHNVADQHSDVVAKAATIFETERTESPHFPIRETRRRRRAGKKKKTQKRK